MQIRFSLIMSAVFGRTVLQRQTTSLWKRFSRCNFGGFVQGQKIKTQPVMPQCYDNDDDRDEAMQQIFRHKEAKGLSIDEIADTLGYTNLYTAQLLQMKSPLNPAKVDLLRDLLDLDTSTMNEMVKAGVRRYDNDIDQEPTVYRLMEAVQHYGESIKMLINEKCGDGIPSAIDMYCDVDVVKGQKGEDRVVLTFNMKYLQFIEQNAAEMESKKRTE